LSVLLLIGYVALLGANSVQPDQDAAKPAAAGGPAIGYAMDAAPDTRMAEQLVLMGSVPLLGADSLQFAQSAPEPAVAGGPAIGYAMEAAAENGLTVEDLGQAYIDWLQAAHAHAALNGRDDPLPSQF
ncbi:MAG TPA: hypothetical protein VIJ43_05585, partial [Burkholderiales bacterium]